MAFLDWLHRLLVGDAPAKRRAPPPEEDAGDDEDIPLPGPDDIVQMPIEEAIDLHTFAPRDVTSVVDEYLHEARKAGFREVRVIHGRGKGVQRAAVRRLLASHPCVESFGDAPASRGGWGATLVRLRPVDARSPPR
jgi:dsDNA-specific endonuclease/ATPase MutS2